MVDDELMRPFFTALSSTAPDSTRGMFGLGLSKSRYHLAIQDFESPIRYAR